MVSPAPAASQVNGRVNGIVDDSEDEKPLSSRIKKVGKVKVEDSDSDDNVPLAVRKKTADPAAKQVSTTPVKSPPASAKATPSKAVKAPPAKAIPSTPGSSKNASTSKVAARPPASSSKPPASSSKPPASSSKTASSTSKPPAKRSSDFQDEKVVKKLKTEPAAAVKKEPAGAVKKEPAGAVKKEPAAAVKKEPTGAVKKEPAAAVKKGPAAAVKKEQEKTPPPRKRGLEQKSTSPSSSKKPKVENSDDSSSVEEDEEEEEEEDDDYEDDDDDEPIKKRISVKKTSSSVTKSAAGKKVVQTKKTVDTKIVSKKTGAGGSKVWWTTLEHNGVIFPPPYQPHGVKMLYDGKPVGLTPEQEEVATMFAVMKDTDYAAKVQFRKNFWTDWKTLLGAKHTIKKLELCDFTPIYDWHQQEKEKKKQMTTEEKKQVKEEKTKLEEKYMWALVDGVKEKVGNFRVEPPGLFRGRGEHPKMGKLKKRIYPEDIVINIGKDAPVPECPMPGHRWKDIKNDNSVSWLAFWNDPINTKEFKYVFLHQSSSLKAQSDKEKYEKARKLKDYIDNIRRKYTKDFNSSDSSQRQIAVATYLIDRLALRAGNEKDDDEADTVGCCSLKVEHVDCVAPKSLAFDFLGKDSIRYLNTVEVEEKVYAAIKDFKKGKKDGDDLFDKLDTSKLNAHLKEFMPGLTAKVFRTYNASITLDAQIENTVGSNVNEKYADYLRANKEVAILCNHQRSVSKTHGAQMERLEGKMAELKTLREEIAKDLDRVKKGKPALKDKEGKSKRNQTPEQLEKKMDQTDKKIEKMELDMRTKDDLKTVALGTSKINYMDPRITVAWCKRNEVPIEKVFNKSLLGKFAWAMDVEPDFRF